MKPGGVLLVLAGVWVLCQVLGGNAIKRLGLEAGTTADTPKAGPVPPGTKDPLGRPY